MKFKHILNEARKPKDLTDVTSLVKKVSIKKFLEEITDLEKGICVDFKNIIVDGLFYSIFDEDQMEYILDSNGYSEFDDYDEDDDSCGDAEDKVISTEVGDFKNLIYSYENDYGIDDFDALIEFIGKKHKKVKVYGFDADGDTDDELYQYENYYFVIED